MSEIPNLQAENHGTDLSQPVTLATFFAGPEVCRMIGIEEYRYNAAHKLLIRLVNTYEGQPQFISGYIGGPTGQEDGIDSIIPELIGISGMVEFRRFLKESEGETNENTYELIINNSYPEFQIALSVNFAENANVPGGFWLSVEKEKKDKSREIEPESALQLLHQIDMCVQVKEDIDIRTLESLLSNQDEAIRPFVLEIIDIACFHNRYKYKLVPELTSSIFTWVNALDCDNCTIEDLTDVGKGVLNDAFDIFSLNSDTKLPDGFKRTLKNNSLTVFTRYRYIRFRNTAYKKLLEEFLTTLGFPIDS